MEGDVDVAAVRRAIELSTTKYYTVTGNLASDVVEIRHAYVVCDAAGQEHYGEVVVTEPQESLDHLGAEWWSRVGEQDRSGGGA